MINCLVRSLRWRRPSIRTGFKGVALRTLTAQASDLLKLFGLFEARNRPAQTLSRGMQQRLAIARAFLAPRPVVVTCGARGRIVASLCRSAVRRLRVRRGVVAAGAWCGELFAGAGIKIPVRPADDRFNNPPWVQMYVGLWQDVPKTNPKGWADTSPDRYTTTVIGAVSRDRRYLAALANDSADSMAQAWHDCMHNNPRWLPAESLPEKRVWRLKIYVMENDPEALLARVAKDFPNARPRRR